MFTKITICTIAVATILLPTTLSAEDISQPPSQKVAIMLLVNSEGAKWHIPASEIKYVLKNESGYDENAIGDHGEARNVAQYHQETFDQYESLYFKATGRHLNYNSATDQVKLLSWQWATFPQSKTEWSTWRSKFGILNRHSIKK